MDSDLQNMEFDLRDEECSGMEAPSSSSSTTTEAHDGDQTVDFSQDPFFISPLPVPRSDDTDVKSSFRFKSPLTVEDPFAILEEEERKYDDVDSLPNREREFVGSDTLSNQEGEYVGFDTLSNQEGEYVGFDTLSNQEGELVEIDTLPNQETGYVGIDTLPNQVKGYVGIDTLPNQVQRTHLKRGFDFNLMVVGESGLGKSTLINSLFLTNLYTDRILYDVSEKLTKTVSITKNTVEILENGVKLKLTVIDTPGFGDTLNNSKSWHAAVDYVNQQLEKYHRDELGLNRKNMKDNRVHCCLYFISPHGHGLRPIDVSFMMALHEKVNIVPVLAKADSFTTTEIQKMKTQIRSEITKYKIQIFKFPESSLDEHEFLGIQDLKKIIPFAIIGSNTVIESNGRRVRARVYPWGIVDVENPSHCDFVHLRNMLIRTHMQHLKDVTHLRMYENFRINTLCKNPCLVNE